MDTNTSRVVYTLSARCRDCYKCLKVCPVKAIRMHDGQAYVDEERCISCGTCVAMCPQGAKAIRNDVNKVRSLIADNPFVAVSMAPSYGGMYSDWQRKRLPSALRALGFKYVGQVSHGAYHIARASYELVKKNARKPYIATACPALVHYIQKYEPGLAGDLIPLLSPMMAHAALLRKKLGKDIKVVFVGPCVAKKSEAEWPSTKGMVDAVLTFSELEEWLEQSNIKLASCDESRFDEGPLSIAQMFPLPGGMVKTAGLIADNFDTCVAHMNGMEEIKTLKALASEKDVYDLIEPLFCKGGCLFGPGAPREIKTADKKLNLIKYSKECEMTELPPLDSSGFTSVYEAMPIHEIPVREEEISEVFKMTGKLDPRERLNCGSCGYETCRDKAIAVVRGMAEPEMCLPYMRRKAEQRTDRIIDTSPNGIVILNEMLEVIGMNPAFRNMFGCDEDTLGRHISFLMDPMPFERVVSGAELIVDTTEEFKAINTYCHVLVYPLKEEKQIVGIFINITHFQKNEEELKKIKKQTIEKAKELMAHQIEMAEKLAHFLGTSTAKGEEIVDKLIRLGGDENEKRP